MKPGEDVDRKGHELEAEVQRDEVACRGHEHHAARGKEHQGIIFAAVDVLDLQVVDGQQDAEAAGDVENELEVRGERIEMERAAEEHPAGVPSAR